MKYYREITQWGYEKPYDISDLPVGKPIWGFAYEIKNDTMHRVCYSKPVRGEIVVSPYHTKFYPYKKNGKLCESKGVSFESRRYADTYEEAVEMYNELVQDRINRLRTAAIQAERDKILMTVTVDDNTHTVTTKLYDTDGWYE